MDEAETLGEARRLIALGGYDAMALDVKLGTENGMELLAEVRQKLPDLGVVIITAFATIDVAIEALRGGAADFLIKPFSPDQIRTAVGRTIRYRRLQDETRRLRREVVDRWIGRPVRSASAAITEIESVIEKAAPTKATVLLQGESGTGKEVYARYIHEKSPRAEGPFVKVNCAALPENLIESELFGHTRGAFTGATQERRGAFQAATGGTLFLDEIGDMPLGLQAKLLGAVESSEFRRLGADRPVAVDTRILAATNADLEALSRAGKFRPDLFFRLNVISIRLPPLRERPEDIQKLTGEFLDRFSRETTRPPKRLEPAAVDALRAYSWPGNIRELKNVIEQAVILADGDTIRAADLSLRQADPLTRPASIRSLEEIERQAIETALKAFGGNRSKASEALGISPATLWRKMRASS
ncbi:sigma-54-dependent Fis family transcriptional regulator [bacterium]|nr:sigma-54-dependent Fis family transcriptional regulator [bacterium]